MHFANQHDESCGGGGVPDHQLSSAIHIALLDAFHLGRSEITVEVSNGVITLSGSVNSSTARDNIESLVRSIPGVIKIQNNIVAIE